jgi:alkanesulfonate monooxygenase SsuD/methylene tetrahydromethanopterin reductase-like flavin-dependent oxidoreductase (luciferase family)
MVHHHRIDFYRTELQVFQQRPMLARIAGESGDMALGTDMYSARQPQMEVVENLATLDALSGGRLISRSARATNQTGRVRDGTTE